MAASEEQRLLQDSLGRPGRTAWAFVFSATTETRWTSYVAQRNMIAHHLAAGLKSFDVTAFFEMGFAYYVESVTAHDYRRQ